MGKDILRAVSEPLNLISRKDYLRIVMGKPKFIHLEPSKEAFPNYEPDGDIKVEIKPDPIEHSDMGP
jgi:hypothetical protein